MAGGVVEPLLSALRPIRMRRRHVTAALILSAAATLAGCGSAANDPPVDATTFRDVDADSHVVGHGILMQVTSTAPIQLCVGPVAESYPPQCGGPTIVGDVDWDVVKTERANGVTWTSSEVWAIGRFTPQAGKAGTFTLTKPLQAKPPAGIPEAAAEPVDLPQLCTDPYAGGGSRTEDGADTSALTDRMTSLDGYVSSWVSDGSSLFNVLVTGDAAAAHRELRTVWKGGLCVEQRDLPTDADLSAAQQALGQQAKDLGLLTFGGDAQGTLGVEATFVDDATRARILTIVKPWLTPEQVRISSALQPLSRWSAPTLPPDVGLSHFA